MDDRDALAAALGEALGRRVANAPGQRVHGGSINECHRWETDGGPVFVKLASEHGYAMFEAEAAGLAELERAAAVRVPKVLALGQGGGQAFLALEWIEFGAGGNRSDEHLGEQLAALHRYRAARHGFHVDDYIGSTPQPNAWEDDWVEFLRLRRLGHQLELAARHGYGGRLYDRGRRLLEVLDVFFSTYRPEPSLLHGDLWGGNWGAGADGEPVIYDPAAYYGDRETDIAMTRLFGGFGPRFYSAYVASYPLDQASGTRSTLYNLYHVLNHMNLFGGGYRAQAEQMIDSLLASAGA
jgi:fructosamine-3-kinase